MIQGCVEEDLVGRVPGTTLHAHGLRDRALLLKVAVGDNDTVLAEQCNVAAVAAPDDILHPRDLEFRHRLARVCVEQRHLVLGRKQQPTREPCEEHAIGTGVRRRELLDDLVLEVHDQNLAVLVEHSKAVARHEDCRQARAAVVLRGVGLGTSVSVESEQLVRAAVRLRANQHAAARLVKGIIREGARAVAQSARLRVPPAPKRHDWHVALAAELVHSQVLVLDVKHATVVYVVSGALALELEDNHATVVAGGEKVLLGVGRQDPEAVCTEGWAWDASRWVCVVVGWVVGSK